MYDQTIENDVFDENVEPEMMCVGQTFSSPIIKRKMRNSSSSETFSSVLSRRMHDNPERRIAPLQISITTGTPILPPKGNKDSGIQDIFDSPDGQGPGLERLYNHVTESGDVPEDNTDEDNFRHATRPIAIPSPNTGSDSRGFRYGSAVSETSDLDSPLANSFSSGLRRRTSSVSLTVYQWSRIRAAYANATTPEGSVDSTYGRGLGNRSISGPCLQSPSRSIATQTPTEHFSYEFPCQEDGDRGDVTDRRIARTGSSWHNETTGRRNRFLLSFFGGILNRNSLPDVVPPRCSRSLNGAEEVGQDLRIIGDDLDRIGCRSRSFSMDRRRGST